MPIKRTSLDERIEALSAHWELHRPKIDGRIPLVVQLPGCGGKKPFQNTWAKVANDSGVAALVVDSHAPRAISQFDAYSQVCTGLILRGAERAGDLIAALEWARRQDWVDPKRLYAGGWSHGGWTIIDALCLGDRIERFTGLHDAPPQPFAGLLAAFLVYPYGGPGMAAHTRPMTAAPDLTAIVCGRDYIVGQHAPVRVLHRLKAQGAKLDVEIFPNGTHAFDEPDARDLRVQYDPALTSRAHKLYRDFLTQSRD
ncbi:MAG: prolyl oligopeptidase family serine peptidase [Caulobacterales bacterium]